MHNVVNNSITNTAQGAVTRAIWAGCFVAVVLYLWMQSHPLLYYVYCLFAIWFLSLAVTNRSVLRFVVGDGESSYVKTFAAIIGGVVLLEILVREIQYGVHGRLATSPHSAF